MSGLHAEIHHAGGEWTIADDGLSTNGTYVDERRVAGRQRLQDGSRVRVGRTVLAYRAAQATAIGETVVATSAPQGAADRHPAQRAGGALPAVP